MTNNHTPSESNSSEMKDVPDSFHGRSLFNSNNHSLNMVSTNSFFSNITTHISRNSEYVQNPNSAIHPDIQVPDVPQLPLHMVSSQLPSHGMAGMPADFDDFSLDMISADMDFEAAYSTFNGLQQQHAQSEIEMLQKQQQQLLMQQTQVKLPSPSPPPPSQQSQQFAPPGLAANVADPLYTHHHFPGNTDYDIKQEFDKKLFEQHRQQILQGLKPTHPSQGLIPMSGTPLSGQDPKYFLLDLDSPNQYPDMQNHLDSLLSVTESSAIEHFLDTLDEDVSNFLQPRHVSQPSLPSEITYNLDGGYARKRAPSIHDQINEAFEYGGDYRAPAQPPATTNSRVSKPKKAVANSFGQQLSDVGAKLAKSDVSFEPIFPTYTAGQQYPEVPLQEVQHWDFPPNALSQDPSRAGSVISPAKISTNNTPLSSAPSSEFSSTKVNKAEDDTTLPGNAAKKKRTPRKALLTLEQKRENHTTSEQRRRQLIKDAFDALMDAVNGSELDNEIKPVLVKAESLEVPEKGQKKAVARSKLPSKFVVLSSVLKEMQMLESINAELKLMM
ncbi:hypothetical protein BABINDRAFT_6298 [Babjeviella inositovora NRRL Y-12698]|uniref:BHLH domain-containing protein n=1 Tax=Babjeviella inositovora NRRL Y-12698 TaxID=984486 RepID=A0A1E3QVD9_9ASCO|nr:uncharacterized protein BABINDRAFT_6298 [Babjeviella inositovora NRRL Y-12698]ODQ81619.1 hypothetical protein BABINDRAFT_6298 [Babjeviella inositovora NRRL Y-12698]